MGEFALRRGGGWWRFRVPAPHARPQRLHLSPGTLPAPGVPGQVPGSLESRQTKGAESPPPAGMRRARWGRGAGGRTKGLFREAGVWFQGAFPRPAWGSPVPATIAGWRRTPFPVGREERGEGTPVKGPPLAPRPPRPAGSWALLRSSCWHRGPRADPGLLIHSREFRGARGGPGRVRGGWPRTTSVCASGDTPGPNPILGSARPGGVCGVGEPLC